MRPATFIFILIPFLVPLQGYAKKNKKAEMATLAMSSAELRISGLTTEGKRLFGALSPDQQKQISAGKIDKGFNAWMVKLALGEPYYATEHHPVYTDYEEVWLYTKPEITENVKELRIIDPQTSWPTVHRTTERKTCQVGDSFILWDRGVVQEIKTSLKKIYGSCTLDTQEAYLPIVDGKVVEGT